MIVHKPHRPRGVSKSARRDFLNLRRHDLALKHGSKKWTYKGVLTRIFGQGIQRVFKDLPASNTAAITGSVGVAVYDMIRHKRDLNWIPNDVDVFVSIPRSQQHQPLEKMYLVMTKWLRSVRSQGFHYEQKKGGTCYSKAMCIFDFVCTNADDFPKLYLPKISFIARPARTVREICNDFDLPFCGPILRRISRESTIEPRVTTEIFNLYTYRCFFSKVYPDKLTLKGRRTYERIQKYSKREFQFFYGDYDERSTISGRFPRFPHYYHRQSQPACKQFIIASLGREPTRQESIDFNFAV